MGKPAEDRKALANATASSNTVGKPADVRKTSGVVSGNQDKTTSGALRQLQLTDCTSLPVHVHQQLYHGQSQSVADISLVILLTVYLHISRKIYD